MTDPPGDAELLRLAASGDDRAYAAFVERHQGGVWRRALALSHNPADAEDLLQETFLAAWRGAAGFRGVGEARGWLLTIAGHAWTRMTARSGRLEVSSDEESLEVLAQRAGWGTQDDDEGDNDRSALVRTAFERLGPDDRRLLQLRDVDEVPGDEVATLLGLTLPAMKSRLHRARLRLAATCQEVRRGSA